MNILGLSFGFHDSAAALVVDGQVVAAAQEERFTRIKHDASYPARAVEFCLKHTGIEAGAIHRVVFHEDTALKFARLVRSSLRTGSKGLAHLRKACAHWIQERKFFPKDTIRHRLNLPASRIGHVQHHLAHAASAYFCSPFERATVLTIDGIGEDETFTVSIGEGTRLQKIASVRFPNSLGLCYSALTAYLGFEVNEGEYKVMGMAGFGEPLHWRRFFECFDLSRPLDFRINQQLFNFHHPGDHLYAPALTAEFGPARTPESPFGLDRNSYGALALEDQRFANIAASVQQATEEVLLALVNQAVNRTGIKQVCLSGGVALNSVANARLQTELGLDLCVHPAAGDAGCALGAALAISISSGARRAPPLVSASLGPEFTSDEIRAALTRAGIPRPHHMQTSIALTEAVSRRLAEGRVVGWMQGREEWGPRALGNRSILASPVSAGMQARVNEKIKFREPFRPFAPSILADQAHEFFECPAELTLTAPESFMLAVRKAKPAARERMPAVVHVDGTSRVHTVHCESNPLFYQLIKAFSEKTGVPALLNTSFNLRGQPVVGAPADAIETFGYSGIDTLAIGPFVVDKEDL